MTQPRSRRGTIYLLVLVTSVIVTMIGLLGFKMIHAQAAVARADTQRDEAAVLAESAVQWGVHYTLLKDNWRASTTSGTTVRSVNLGQGQITVVITDADGDLDNGDADVFTISGTGTIGSASQTYEVTIGPCVGAAHPALNDSLTVSGTLYADQDTVTLESGGTAIDHKSSIKRRISNKVITVTNPVDIPDPSLITTWEGMGTVITRAMHGGQINLTAMSSAVAPFGVTPDPNGIYIVDAEESNLTISNTQITGTLVVTNLGGNPLVLNDSVLRFGPNGGPTLIVDGEMNFESDALSEIQQGILYINGNANIKNNMILLGKLMATGNVAVDASVGYVTMNEHPSAILGPPAGFTISSGGFEVVPGSWQRIVN